MMRFLLTIALLAGAFTAAPAHADPGMIVTTPYVEMRTGPGRGFPVFHVAARDEPLVLKKQRTSWVKVETAERRPVRGWVHVDHLEGMRLAEHSDSRLVTPGPKRFEWSISGGDFAGASAVSSELALRVTSNIFLQARGTQVLGNFSNGWLATAAVRHKPFPNWRISPWFELGGGLLHTEPFSTIVQASDRKDNLISVGTGLDVRLARRLTMFMDYHRHTVLTSRDENEEIDEWKIGFRVSF